MEQRKTSLLCIAAETESPAEENESLGGRRQAEIDRCRAVSTGWPTRLRELPSDWLYRTDILSAPSFGSQPDSIFNPPPVCSGREQPVPTQRTVSRTTNYEHVTFNHGVEGSSPSALTNEKPLQNRHFLDFSKARISAEKIAKIEFGCIFGCSSKP